MSDTQLRCLAFIVGLAIFTILAVMATVAIWFAGSFVTLHFRAFPWMLMRVLIVVGAVLAFCFACSDQAVD